VKQRTDQFFIGLLILVSAAFIWVIQPLFGAILWGVVAAILFAPLNRWLMRKMPKRSNSAALLTLLAILAVGVLPAVALASALVQEASALYGAIQLGNIDFEVHFNRVQAVLPHWAHQMLERLGVGDFDTLRDRLENGASEALKVVAGQAVEVGRGALGFFLGLFVMLYLTFFLLRDGRGIAARVDRAVPLPADLRSALAEKFLAVVRAIVKGSLIVAILQGLVGGLIFWFLGLPGALLWGVAMGFLSLLPAVGTGLIWAPVALYLLATGDVWQGLFLAFCGIFVIGLIDNILRPVLVGHDTRMPDYIVFIATLGGLELFGFNGIIMGPMIAALFLTVWEVFGNHRAATD
jgi:predicted PurR-regulated permease PerM